MRRAPGLIVVASMIAAIAIAAPAALGARTITPQQIYGFPVSGSAPYMHQVVAEFTVSPRVLAKQVTVTIDGHRAARINHVGATSTSYAALMPEALRLRVSAFHRVVVRVCTASGCATGSKRLFLHQQSL